MLKGKFKGDPLKITVTNFKRDYSSIVANKESNVKLSPKVNNNILYILSIVKTFRFEIYQLNIFIYCIE